MKVYTDAKRPPFRPTEPGGHFQPHYELVPETGEVEVVGEDNIHEMIQASETSSRLDCILAKYEQSGDSSVLDIRRSIFADVTTAPGSLQESIMMARNALYIYENLTPEERVQYPTFNAMVEALSKGSESPAAPAASSEPAKEVKEGESNDNA